MQSEHLIVPALLKQYQGVRRVHGEYVINNVTMFGHPAKQWRDANPELDVNIRDHATFRQV